MDPLVMDSWFWVMDSWITDSWRNGYFILHLVDIYKFSYNDFWHDFVKYCFIADWNCTDDPSRESVRCDMSGPDPICQPDCNFQADEASCASIPQITSCTAWGYYEPVYMADIPHGHCSGWDYIINNFLFSNLLEPVCQNVNKSYAFIKCVVWCFENFCFVLRYDVKRVVA